MLVQCLEKNGFNMELIKEIEKIKKPDWLRVKLPTGENYIKVRGIFWQDNKRLGIINKRG